MGLVERIKNIGKEVKEVLTLFGLGAITSIAAVETKYDVPAEYKELTYTAIGIISLLLVSYMTYRFSPYYNNIQNTRETKNGR